MDETTLDETHSSQNPEDLTEVSPSPSGMLAALDELLRRPLQVMNRAELRDMASLRWLVFGGLLCFLIYGLASGFFQGGAQIMVTAFKVPIIVLGSLLLCLPSLYVLTALAGVDVTPRWFIALVVGLFGMLGLQLVALMPITWLFSVSSSSLGFIVFLHFSIWMVTVAFAYRFLAVATRDRATGALTAWLFLFMFVSFQMASQMRPVLWRPEGMAVFAPQRMFFFQHLGQVLESNEGPKATSDD